MPTSNKEALAVASDVFKQKYGDKFFNIFGPTHANDSKIMEFNDSIVISDLETAIKIVEKFGSSIKKVEVNFEHFNLASHQEIIKQVNALESLVDLHLSKCRGNLFKKLSKPFKNVKYLRMQGQLNTLKSETLQLNELFPALQELDCAYLYTLDGKSIEQRMPNLSYLNVMFLKAAFSEANIENLLKMNTQITNLKLHYNTPGFIKKVSEYLPNLEKISFEMASPNATDDSDLEIHLKNVKEAQISSKYSYSLGKLTFEKLDVLGLEIIGPSGFADPVGLSNDWIQFATKNEQLKKLKISNGLLNDEQLLKIGEMENLTDINIGCDKAVSINTVMEFLKNIPKLKTAYFKNLEISKQDALRVELSDEWKSLFFNRLGGRDVCFMRTTKM